MQDNRTLNVILHQAMRPVLLVPETTEPELRHTVLVAYDGSGAAKRAITSFAASGIAQDATFTSRPWTTTASSPEKCRSAP